MTGAPGAVLEERSIIAEIEGTFASDRPDIVRRVTDLFLAGADNYSDDHVDLFDGVISRIAEKIETKARAELAHRLAPAPNCASEDRAKAGARRVDEVAGPILSLSKLSDEDMLAIASGKGQDRLLAISKPPLAQRKGQRRAGDARQS